MADPKAYAGYVDVTYLERAAEHARQDKQLSYAAMRVQPGFRVLDVGCGPASDTIALAGLVGERGEVVGVDYDEEMVAEANRRAVAAGLEEYEQQGAFFATLNHNLVAGRKP
jgi:ubiquinone/menaquinone biosynthesis C-methylase UbiE